MNKANCISSISECDTAHDGMKYLRLINRIWFWLNVICCMLWAMVMVYVISCGGGGGEGIAHVFVVLGVGVLWIALTSIVYLCCNALIDWLGAVLSGFTALNYGVNRTVSTLNKMSDNQNKALQYICDRLADIQDNQLNVEEN